MHYRGTRTVIRYYATIPRPVLGKIHEIIGSQASYIPPDHPTAPIKGGWLIREATINPPLDQEELEDSGTILTRVDDVEGFPPPLSAPAGDDKPGASRAGDTPDDAPAPGLLTPHSEIAYLASAVPLPLAVDPGLWKVHVLLDRRLDLVRGTYFLKSPLTFQAMTRKSNWYQFATTPDLLQSLTDPSLEGSSKWRSSSTAGCCGRSWAWPCCS